MISVSAKRREVLPILLNGTLCLQISDEQEEKLLHILRQLPQPTIHLLLDLHLMCH